MLLCARVRAQADDGGDVAHVPAFLEHEDGDDGLVGDCPGVDLVGLLAEQFEFLLVLAGSGFGDFAVVLGVDDEHRALQFGADLFEVGADLVAVAGVVHHDEEHGLLAERLVFGVALAPFLDAELQVVVVFLGEDGALVLLQLGAAGGVRQDGMLDDVLVDGLDQRIVGDRLHEDRAVVVARRGGHVHLQGQTAILLQHLVVDVLNGLEPRHLRVVDVVRLVVEHGQFVDFADDLAEIGLAVGGLADRLRAEGREEVVAQVVVFQRRLAHVAEKDAVDVGQKEIAGVANDADIVLDVEGELEIVAPVAAFVAVVRQDRIVEENPQTVEVGTQAVEDDDVRAR